MDNLKKTQLLMFNTKQASQEMSAVSLLFSLTIKILNNFQQNTVYFNTLIRFLDVLATYLQSIIENIM
jgi:hypothetical protein